MFTNFNSCEGIELQYGTELLCIVRSAGCSLVRRGTSERPPPRARGDLKNEKWNVFSKTFSGCCWYEKSCSSHGTRSRFCRFARFGNSRLFLPPGTGPPFRFFGVFVSTFSCPIFWYLLSPYSVKIVRKLSRVQKFSRAKTKPPASFLALRLSFLICFWV